VSRRKGLLIVAIVLSIPVLLSTQVWQVFRFKNLEGDVAAMGSEQRKWLERNKKALASIAVFSSPERIEQVAREDLGLEEIDYRNVLSIRLSAEEEEF
jgi:hypothetical protein